MQGTGATAGVAAGTAGGAELGQTAAAEGSAAVEDTAPEDTAAEDTAAVALQVDGSTGAVAVNAVQG